MMNLGHRTSRLAALGLLLLSACSLPQPQADTVRNFTLSGPAPAVADGAVVRPVQLAGHLRSRVMAVRVADHEVIYVEDARWAESLDDAITQVLRARLGALGSGRVVSVQVQRCEPVRHEGNTVQLAATYTITSPGDDSAEVRRGQFTAKPRPWDGRDYGALVGLMREAVGELGDELAAVLAK
ncbi:MAG: membrane integrity-associated transporter subunit PqiC [Opitutaceae bacterium]|nr:membrane integrity-associated transporter subunit PqiC [Opitutaceae bacterium]